MQRQQFPGTESSDGTQDITLDREYIRSRTRWIRDDLDPRIAREGPDTLTPDSVITLFTFLEELRSASISAETLRCTRVHRALLDISGHATRWPGKLVDKVDDLINHWNHVYGPLHAVRPLLYDQGGRLHGISLPEDLERDKLLIKWLRTPATPISPAISRRHGDLGFRPGDWWINAMFAYRAGIIDNGNPSGGITCDGEDAYALLMTYNDELSGPSANSFVYRSKSPDPGRYRLTAATMESRHPIRVLRSHTLRSFWTPRAGVRYDGLFKVTGWTITHDPRIRQWYYDISFARIAENQPTMAEALRHPSAEEVDDFYEYKRIRREVRMNRNPLMRARPLSKSPDGAQLRRQSQIYSQQLQHHHHNHQQHHHHRHPQQQPGSPTLSPKDTQKATKMYSEMLIGVTLPLMPLNGEISSSPSSSSPISSTYTEGADERAARLSLDLSMMRNTIDQSVMASLTLPGSDGA